ncbi:MAG: RHS repeat-associated core domain-containing protein [Nitrospirota bacterium]
MALPYDPASQVTNILHQLTATATQINQAAYAYNTVGNRTSLTDRRGAQAFGYDTLDRLTSASHPLLATPQAFAYDAVGNRTTDGSVVNAGNQLTADANYAYQYDDNGNLIRKTLLATGNFTVYTYDAENRLTKVEEFAAGNPTAIATSTYRYDGLGRRIEKVGNGITRRYVYDGEDILLEYDGTNTLQARYTRGPGIDEPIAVMRGGSTFFYHQDGLRTVTELTDTSGAIAKAYAYDAYGNIVDQTGAVENPYTYTGREFDAETGLYYYRARYYDSVAGRFLQKDPIGQTGGPNAYQYVSNNPINFVDPAGAASIDIPFPSDPSIPGIGAIGRVLGGLGLILNILTIPGDTPCPECPPCRTVSGKVVPVGTVAYRPMETPPAGEVEHGIAGPHYNLYRANQAPRNSPKPCKCFWQPIDAVKATNLPMGAIPIEPFAE